MNATAYRRTPLLILALTIFCCSFSTGCIQEMAQLLYVIKGHDVPPAVEGLEEKRVAVVCLADSAAHGPDSLSVSVANRISVAIANSKEKMKVISPKKVQNYIDTHGWGEDGPADLGAVVEADFVIVVEVENYSIHDGATLYKGRADWTATVYDVAEAGTIKFAQGPELFVFPEHGRPSVQTTEREFEAFYLTRLCDRIAKLFITHDKLSSYAESAILQ